MTSDWVLFWASRASSLSCSSKSPSSSSTMLFTILLFNIESGSKTKEVNQHDRSGSWREFLWEFELAIDVVKSILGNISNKYLSLNLFLRYISKDGNSILESKGCARSLFGHNYSHFSSTESIYWRIHKSGATPWRRHLRLFIKGWMTRQFFGLSESVCPETYLSQIKVHTEQGM